MSRIRRWGWTAIAGVGLASALGATLALAAPSHRTARAHSATATTATPIKHVVVIFDENVSFDHYFGTYPHTNNLADTPGLGGHGTLLTNNPNRDASGNQVNPRRLDPTNINDVAVLEALQRWAQDHGPARASDWTVGTHEHPCRRLVTERFGSWKPPYTPRVFTYPAPRRNGHNSG